MVNNTLTMEVQADNRATAQLKSSGFGGVCVLIRPETKWTPDGLRLLAEAIKGAAGMMEVKNAAM